MIYNYEDEWFNVSFGLYTFSSTALLIILAYCILKIIKHWHIEGKQLGWIYIVGAILILAIPIFVFTCESQKLYTVLSYDYAYKNETYQEAKGKLNIISLETVDFYDNSDSPYRYFVSFSVDDKIIKGFYPISENSKRNLVDSNGKEILVRYMYDEDFEEENEVLIFEILELEN